MTALFVVAVVLFWLLTLLVKPFGRCWRCRGKGNIVRKGARKAPKCWLCKGAGRRQRTGSRAVHRIRRSAVAGWQGRKEHKIVSDYGGDAPSRIRKAA